MNTYYSLMPQSHAPRDEFFRGQMVPTFECPARLNLILDRLQKQPLGAMLDIATLPDNQALTASIIARTHDSNYLDFLQNIHRRWCDHEGYDRPEQRDSIEIIPHTFPTRNLRQLPPQSIYGQVGYFAMDTATPITANAYTAAFSAAMVTLHSAAAVICPSPPQTAPTRVRSQLRSDQRPAPSAFALTRPPGHHAAFDAYGGYCFLNYAAIAAEYFLQICSDDKTDASPPPVAILDVDFHHGNGTQQIFYRRNDVLYVSLHADPRFAYPYFLGASDEEGEGAGLGWNLNLPLPIGTAWPEYRVALETALQRIRDSGAQQLIVSLGTDTHREDPISGFSLDTPDFFALGQAIASLNLPTLWIMEGGYAQNVLGESVWQTLHGFES